jgi:cyclopropane fatty-acyl-phospholipid synthase-like methyltransferase
MPDTGNECEPGSISRSPKEIVREGYDRISYAYRDDEGTSNTGYAAWLEQLLPLLDDGARVLDLGCGNGVPVSRVLAERFRLTGVDLSQVQIDRARTLVPKGDFARADMTEVDFSAESFDAVVSFFAIIHVPLEEQQALFRKLAVWLAQGGYLLASVGLNSWTGTEQNWHGAEMYWSHADEATYRRWIAECGLDVLRSAFIPEGSGGHSLLLARKRL